MQADRKATAHLHVSSQLDVENARRRSERSATEDLMAAHERVVGDKTMRSTFNSIDTDGSGSLDAEAGIRWLLDKVEPGRAARKRTRDGGGGEEQERGEAAEGRQGSADESEILRRSGAVHSHLNSNVLGGAKLRTNGKQPMAPPPPPHAPRPAAAAVAAAGSAAQSSAAADAAPSAASKRQKSPLMTPSPTTPPRDLAECLSGATTYAEYTSRLQTDPAVAYRAVYARIAWGEDTLLRAVNALP